jgi:4-hydroxy-tetrahydrodipicolinate reductase
MRIGIFGRGRLGSAVADAVRAEGHEVAFQIGRDGALPSSSVDGVIDASLATAVEAHLDWAAERGVPLAIGVTGIDARALVDRAAGRIGLVIAPNFSLTVALVARLAAVLARYSSITPGFDPYILEKHHARKLDAPSGTAKLLANRMLAQLTNKEGFSMPSETPLTGRELCVSSLRVGDGAQSYHKIGIESRDEVLEVVHEARTMAPAGRGAVHALQFLQGRKGAFSMDDVAREALSGVLGALD